MKKYLLIVMIALAGNFAVHAQSAKGLQAPEISAVNMQDTIVFDLGMATINGDNVQFPVYIKSDDTINSLDFSFKFNHSNLVYDSIINLMVQLQPVSYYDALDSTVRFSSYSSVQYKKDTPIVTIHFTTLSRPISSSDFNTLKGYLNGDACSVRVIDALTTGLPGNINNEPVKIYPNPANNMINVELSEKSTVQLFDENGNAVSMPVTVNKNQLQNINTGTLADGIYIMKISNGGFLSFKKVVINKENRKR